VANSLHGSEDVITLVLSGREVVLCETYTVKVAIFTQPAAFSLKLGDNDAAKKILSAYPPGTPFQLKINDLTIQTGRIDSLSTSGAATAVVINGRDNLALLHDGYVEQEVTYKDISYHDLVRKRLDAQGLAGLSLRSTNEANRRKITGGDIRQLAPPRNVEQLKIETDSGGFTVKKETQAHLGERDYEFLRRHLDHGGLYLWCAGDGSFVLSEPNPAQAPLYALTRNYEKPYGCNILEEHFTNDTSSRFSEFLVYLKASKKGVRATATAKATDDEMVAWGFTRRMVMKDVNADTPEKAKFWALRKMRETRRQGYRLSYTVRGHTTTSLTGGQGKKVAWAPDTIVTVYDDKLGFNGTDFWIEGVTFNGDPATTTTLDIMRTHDVLQEKV